MLPCYKSTERDKAGLVYHLYILNCPVCRHVFILYISKYSFANVIMPKMPIFLSFIGRGEVSDLCLTSAFPLPPQEITAEGRKWKRVSQAGYD